MPSRNSIKHFAEDQMWHVYNRGVDKRNIFLDDQDYIVFLSFLKTALAPPREVESHPSKEDESKEQPPARLNLHSQVKLVSYCLMPNHFHLQLYQISADGISQLMRSIMTGYVLYFNNKYDRQGVLFQGVYKGAHVYSDEYWEHISRYVHLNPLGIGEDHKLYPYSSYRYFRDSPNTPEWVFPALALESFADFSEYEKFCDDYIEYRSDIKEFNHFIADT